MKFHALFFLLIFPATAFCQHTEMDIYKGLMYSPEDMRHLRMIADSLNLKYLQCTSTPEYHSLPQAGAFYVNFKFSDTGKKDTIEKMLKEGRPFEEIRSKFPGMEMKDSGAVQVVLQNYYNSYNKKYLRLFIAGTGRGFDELSTEYGNKHVRGQGDWLYRIGSGFGSNGEYLLISAWRLETPLQSVKLPERYARLIQYVDCMVDTSTVLMLREWTAKNAYRNEGIGKLHAYVSMKTAWTEPQTRIPEASKITYLRQEDVDYARKHYAEDPIIRKWIKLAVEEALQNGNGSEELEQIVAAVYPKDTLLLMKRSRPVIGSCSMDESPRYHARDIAILASQTHQWPVFIKAHLNIMNDRFERAVDASYAWAGRKTYLRELEALDIPTIDLLLGMVFRTQNMSPQHYNGNVSRIGRALSETKYVDQFENTIKKMIKDEQLDVFNRSLLFLVYTNYCYSQNSFTAMRYRIAELKRERKLYPGFIQDAIEKLHYREQTSFN